MTDCEKEMEGMIIDIIINTYMNNPASYDKSENDYMLTSAKTAKLQNVVDFLKSMNINVTVPDIVKIWKNLESQFKNCLADENNAKTGSAAKENDFPYFESMLFLKPSLQHRTPLSSLSQKNKKEMLRDTTNILYSIGSSANYTESQSSPLRKKKKSSLEEPKQLLSTSYHRLSTTTLAPLKVPEYDIFAKRKLETIKKDESEVSAVSQKMLETLDVVQKKLNLESGATSCNYTNILLQAISKVADGMESECLMYVLNELETFEQTLPKTDLLVIYCVKYPCF